MRSEHPGEERMPQRIGLAVVCFATAAGLLALNYFRPDRPKDYAGLMLMFISLPLIGASVLAGAIALNGKAELACWILGAVVFFAVALLFLWAMRL
jgi:hypothetical protein